MSGRSSTRIDRLARVAALGVLITVGCGGGEREVTVAVASSLRHVMPELVRAFEGGAPGATFALSFGGSGALRKQVEAGAPLDAVVLAGAAPVDALVTEGLAEAGSRRVLARNELVLIVPRGGHEVRFETLPLLPAGERIAIGDPASVPVGRYAKGALEALGLWDALADRMVYAPHVAAVLAFARRGEVGAAIVYRTDVRSLEDVEVRDAARPPWGPTPEVVAAVVVGAEHAERAAALLAFSSTDEGRALIARYGFVPAAP